MGRIAVLDQNMINMIAAGEVIERPASVVKELMENSIDAGATKITVSIEDGGRKLISVSDNGGGMDSEDLANAFEPHTTSKIRTSKDLHCISTLGFRGEALASIASVAQVRAISRMKTEAAGNCIDIDCGHKDTIKPCNCDYGTTIEVRDIFYKLPARRKFLRTANTEAGHITEHFTRIALANCDLDMMLVRNGKQVYQLSGEEGLRQRIAALFSSEILEYLIQTESEEKGLHIFALLGRPGASRPNNKFQYVFLNGRFIRDKFISHAIREAYRPSLEQNRFPLIFLFIEAPYEDYDVNVHPTKIEVRFYNANLVHSQILGCLREKLLEADSGVQAKLPTIACQKSVSACSGSLRDEKIAEAMSEFFQKHRLAPMQNHFAFRSTTAAKTGSIEGMQKHEAHRIEAAHQSHTALLPAGKFLQIHDSFILVATDDGFDIVDQHALHERMIYEDLRRRIKTNKLESQKLLVPESFEMSDVQTETIGNNGELIEKLGIELSPFGPRTWAVQAFPSMLANVSPVDFVQDLIALISSDDAVAEPQRLLDEVLSMAACKAAVKAGQKLSDGEIEQLLASRESIKTAGCCPHGRPTAIKFSIAELERQFKRT